MEALTMQDVRNHPLFSIVLMAVGGDEKKALTMLKKQLEDQALANQAATEFSDTEKKIVVPRSMNKRQASEELMRQWKDEETKMEVVREFENWNWRDVLVAVKRAAEKHFGWVQGTTIRGFFRDQLPQEIEIITDVVGGVKKTETCFYGRFTASVWEDAPVDVGSSHIKATVKKRYADDVREFYDLVQWFLDNKSIYRGKAVTVTEKYNPMTEEDEMDFEIFELKTNPKIILNEDIESVVKNFIIDDLGEEGKRCYLFSGGYGNGKTETAMRIAKAGKEKAMAFFYCKNAELFPELLNQAKNYQPATVFLEDLDEIGAGEERDSEMNEILNTLDGVQTKGNNLTVIFTTNHENRINPALRRPGRIDLVIAFENPSKASVEKIYRAFFEELDTNKALPYGTMAEKTPECSGAVIAEIAKRAVKLCKKRGEVSEEYVNAAIDSMKHHLKLMSEKIETSKNGEMVIVLKGANMNIKEMNGESAVFAHNN